jgi:hypothetical protein
MYSTHMTDNSSQTAYSEHHSKPSSLSQDQFKHLTEGESVTGYKPKQLYWYHHYTN